MLDTLSSRAFLTNNSAQHTRLPETNRFNTLFIMINQIVNLVENYPHHNKVPQI